VTDETLTALLQLQGGRDAIIEGTRLLARTPAADAAARLLGIFDAAVARGLGAHLKADLGEVRGFAYYTGPIFHAYAAGTGDAVLSGGRYDELLARFGCPMPAAGFAVDLDRLTEARRAAGAQAEGDMRVVVLVEEGPADAPGSGDARVTELRGRGVVAVAFAGTPEAARAYARAWGFTHVMEGPALVELSC
jgi:ATP phosphoribosyltransferase regulatory subunit